MLNNLSEQIRHAAAAPKIVRGKLRAWQILLQKSPPTRPNGEKRE